MQSGRKLPMFRRNLLPQSYNAPTFKLKMVAADSSLHAANFLPNYTMSYSGRQSFSYALTAEPQFLHNWTLLIVRVYVMTIVMTVVIQM
jgi:hypothetical protein